MKKLVLVALVLLAACDGYPHGVHVQSRDVRVDVDGGHSNHSNGNGRFCPPGQAKKGRC